MTTDGPGADGPGAEAPPGEHPAGDLGRRRSGRVVAVGVAAVVILAGGFMVLGGGRDDGVSRARRMTGQDSRFVNGPKAGSTFAGIAHILLDDAKRCTRQHGADDPRCQARSSAAAYTTVSAFALVSCTQPGVYRARQALLDELAGISFVDRHHGRASPPAVPAVPTC